MDRNISIRTDDAISLEEKYVSGGGKRVPDPRGCEEGRDVIADAEVGFFRKVADLDRSCSDSSPKGRRRR